MNFEVFEKMYQMFWEALYAILAVFDIDLKK